MANIVPYLRRIKNNMENAIENGGAQAQTSLIRSGKLINELHEFIKEELIERGINGFNISPHRGQTNPEITLFGSFKKKAQDVTVLPSVETTTPERIKEGPLCGEIDPIGSDRSNRSIAINVRSQLSSLRKNYDTLYERTFAEPLNLHLRLPRLVMGEVYMVPVDAYDPEEMKSRRVAFEERLPQSYVPSFLALNDRNMEKGEEYKYERVALLIVDFREDPPRIVDDAGELSSLGIVTSGMEEKPGIESLSIRTFIDDLLNKYKERHGSLELLQQD